MKIRHTKRVRIPLSSRPPKVQQPDTVYNRKKVDNDMGGYEDGTMEWVMSRATPDNTVGDQVMATLDEIEELFEDGKLSKARVNGLLFAVLCRQSKTREEFERREHAIEVLSSLIGQDQGGGDEVNDEV